LTDIGTRQTIPKVKIVSITSEFDQQPNTLQIPHKYRRHVLTVSMTLVNN